MSLTVLPLTSTRIFCCTKSVLRVKEFTVNRCPIL